MASHNDQLELPILIIIDWNTSFRSMFSLVIYAFNRKTQHDINRVDVKENTPKRLYTTYTTSTVGTRNYENICPMRMLSIRHEKN